MRINKKINFLLLAVILTSFFTFESMAQKNPPGTVRFRDNLYVDKHEISNMAWREYMYWTKTKYGNHSEEYEAVLPDTTVWDNILKQIYLRHPSYVFHPVVGISYRQAKKYAQWRTKMVNINYYLKEMKLAYEPDSSYDSIPQVFVYRLPTIEEWEDFSQSPYSKRTLRKMKRNNEPTGKFRPKDYEDMDKIKTRQVQAGYKSKLGLYNVFGNVAEITAKRGVAKGGSWEHYEEQCVPTSGFTYSGPTNWMGFRCVAERVVEETEEAVPEEPSELEVPLE